MKYSSAGVVDSSTPLFIVPGAVRQASGVCVKVGSGVGVSVGSGVNEGVEVKGVSVGVGGTDEEQAVMKARSEQRMLLRILA